MHHKKNLGQKIMPWFIVMIMVLSVLGVMMYGFNDNVSSGSEKYNGFKFQRIENKWVLNTDKGFIVFDYLPQEVKDIELNQDMGNIFNRIEVDTTFSINDTYSKAIALTIYELNNALSTQNVFLRQGLTEENEYNFPVIDCKDSTDIIPVVKFKQGNSTKITAQNHCIIIEANSEEDFLMIKDRILYDIFKVIE